MDNNFDGTAGRESRLAQFYQEFSAEAVILVNHAVVEIFYKEFSAENVNLVIPTLVEIFYCMKLFRKKKQSIR